MKRIFSIIIALVLMVSAASAQNYVYPGHLGMPYVALDGGVVTSLSNPTFADALKNVTPTVGVEVGTYVTPVWGASIQGIGTYDANGWQNFLGKSYVLANGKMNLSNFLAGYKGYPRRIEFALVAGAGWGHNFVAPAAAPEATGEWILTKADGDETGAEPTGGEAPAEPAVAAPANWMAYNTGAEININLGEKRAWQINVRPSVIWNHPDGGYNFDLQNADARLTLGVTYKFGNRRTKSHNFSKNDYAVSQYDYDVLAARLDECRNRPAERVEVPVEVPVEKIVVDTLRVPKYFGEKYITFPCGSSTLSAESKARLQQIVNDGIPAEATVYVIGSADSKTGTETFNYDLAAKRAKVVKAALVDLGLADDEIVIDVTLDATDNVRTSRSAVISIVEE